MGDLGGFWYVIPARIMGSVGLTLMKELVATAHKVMKFTRIRGTITRQS
jgi:hypothetical protein